MVNLIEPTFEMIANNFLDVIKPGHVEVIWSNNTRTLWINANGVCLVRLCKIESLWVQGEKKGECMTKCNRQSLEIEDEYRGYSYEKEKETLFNEEGFKIFIRVRDQAKELLKEGGAFTVAGLMRKVGGDDWDILACVDMLVELGEIDEVKRERDGQYRVFVEKGY